MSNPIKATNTSGVLLVAVLLLVLGLGDIQTVHSACYDPNNVLPVPARSFGNIAQGAEFYVEKLTAETNTENGVYFATTGIYNVMFIVDSDDGVALFDAPSLPSGWTTRAIQSVTQQKVTRFVYSHIHSDHIGDARNFLGATFIAHHKTTEYLVSQAEIQPADKALPVPKVPWCDSYTFKHGSYQVQLSYVPDATSHVEGNSFAWIPEAKVLMMVDVIAPRWVPFHRFGETENITAIQANIDAILAFPFEKFVGGHMARWGDRADITEARDYYTSLLQIASNTLTSPIDYSYLLATGNIWNFIRATNDEAACACVKQLVQRWGGILAAVDVFSESQCYAIQQNIRIGPNPLTVVYPNPLPKEECKECKDKVKTKVEVVTRRVTVTKSVSVKVDDEESNAAESCFGLLTTTLTFLILATTYVYL